MAFWALYTYTSLVTHPLAMGKLARATKLEFLSILITRWLAVGKPFAKALTGPRALEYLQTFLGYPKLPPGLVALLVQDNRQRSPSLLFSLDEYRQIVLSDNVDICVVPGGAIPEANAVTNSSADL